MIVIGLSKYGSIKNQFNTRSKYVKIVKNILDIKTYFVNIAT